MSEPSSSATSDTIISLLVAAEEKYDRYGLDSVQSELGHARTASALALLADRQQTD